VIFTILLAWVTTLPLGALFAASAYWLLQGVG
jgi:phosphate/sulfate permease